ncbi:sodium:solute symporter family protein [Desulfurococcus amylolyticus]|uniref:sodium:solute symporter family protein n=1 Tax=Desulfurococcus amylolyticus TaxID=94694 RepID=UPI0005B1FB9F|nr:sodium:solute symporter family protein [Desulfurococcus amylolyticus]
MNTLFIDILVVYVIMGTVIAYASRRMNIKTTKDYIIAGGRVGSIVSFGTYAATTYSAFMMIGLVGLTYATGVGALGFELLYLLVTVILLSTIGYKIWELSRMNGWMTPSQMLSDLYSSRYLGMLSAFLYLFVMVPYTAAQIQGLTIIFNYAGLDPAVGTIISATITYTWIFIAGMWSIATTDLYQAILMLAGGLLFIVQLTLPGAVFNIDPAKALISSGEKGFLGMTSFWSPQVFLAYTIPWIFFAVTNPQVVIRLFIHRDEKTYKRGVSLFAFYGLLYTLIVVLAGLLVRGFAENGLIPQNLRRDEVTIYLLNLFNPSIGSLIAVSIVAAAVSTANSIIHAVASSIYREMRSHGDKGSLVILNLTSLVLIALSSLLAYARITYIVDLSVMSSVYLLPLAPLTILGIYLNKYIGKYTRTAAITSIVVGVSIAGVSTIVNGGSRAFTSIYMGIPISLWVLLVSTAILLIGLLIDAYTRV